MLRDKILSTKPVVTSVVVPEWGETVYVKALSGADFARVRQATHKLPQDVQHVVAEIWFALLSMCDQHGQRLMADTDYDGLAAQPATAINRVARAAVQANGLDAEGVDAAKNG